MQLAKALDDKAFMAEAIELARRGVGKTSPNPAVGALIVSGARGGSVVGRGYHKKAGGAHAEVLAIRDAGRKARGGTIYVTLEPCCHHGRTPPCTEAIIKAGVKRVVVGSGDPNPLVRSKGVRALRRAGISVTTAILKEECAALNEAYNRYIVTGRPFVTLKVASTLDGRIGTSTGESQWITSEASRREVHRMRAAVDGVMVGSGTARADDPALTVRRGGRTLRGGPKRIVLDSTLKGKPECNLLKTFNDGFGGEVIYFTSGKTPLKRVALYEGLGARVIRVKGVRGGGLDLHEVISELGTMEVTSLLVEGGGTLGGGLLEAGLVDKVACFIGSKIIGGDGIASFSGIGVRSLKDSVELEGLTSQSIGGDILVEGYIKKRPRG